MKPSTPEQENIIKIFNTRDETRWELAFILAKDNWKELYLKIIKDSIEGIDVLDTLVNNKKDTSKVLFPNLHSIWQGVYYGRMLELVPNWQNKTA